MAYKLRRTFTFLKVERKPKEEYLMMCKNQLLTLKFEIHIKLYWNIAMTVYMLSMTVFNLRGESSCNRDCKTHKS